jgi:hypothetical protein
MSECFELCCAGEWRAIEFRGFLASTIIGIERQITIRFVLPKPEIAAASLVDLARRFSAEAIRYRGQSILLEAAVTLAAVDKPHSGNWGVVRVIYELGTGQP